MTADEIVELHKSRKKFHFDDLPAMSTHRPALITDLDLDTVKEYLKNIGKEKIIEKLNLKQYLMNNTMTVNGSVKVRNIAILLFGKDPSFFLPQNRVSIAVFPSTKITSEFTKKEISGSIGNIVKQTFFELDWHNRTFSFVRGSKRIDVKEYPIEALREAVINAIAHRDYFTEESELFIKIFKDKIEIVNPGGFPYGGYSFEEIEKSGLSIRRNPRLALSLEKLKFMEQEGRGLKRIKDILTEHGLPPPTIEVTKNTFKLTVHGVGDSNRENLLNSPFRITSDLSRFNDRQLSLLEKLEELKSINRSEYCALFNVPSRTALRDLVGLFHAGVLKRTGLKKGTRYKLSD